MNDEQMTWRPPIILIGLLAGGAAMFAANALCPVPIEAYFAIAGGIMFVSGMLFGLIASLRSILVIARPNPRRASGIIMPLLVLIITTATWFVVIATAIEAKRSLDKREQFEREHWNELHRKDAGISQPAAGDCLPGSK